MVPGRGASGPAVDRATYDGGVDEREQIDRPKVPWVGIVVGALLVLAALSIVQFFLAFLFGLVRVAIVAAVVLVVLYLVVIGPPGRD
ncbi:hypothetical protein BH20ACT2_BH20ACT2_19650 [soil metagenome]